MDIVWLEVWIDGPGLDYCLLLRQLKSGKLELVDLKTNRVLDIAFKNYAEARTWFSEEEYDLIEGRYDVSDRM